MSSTKTQCRPPIRSDDLVKVAEPNCLRETYVAISEHFKNLTVSSYELLSKWCLYTVCQIVYVPFAWSVRQGAAARAPAAERARLRYLSAPVLAALAAANRPHGNVTQVSDSCILLVEYG